MSVLRFPQVLKQKDTSICVKTAPPACDVTVTKDGRTRRFWIRLSPDGTEWYAQVFFGATQHRGMRGSRYDADRLYAEYQREIAELLKDGWR